jgi:hypothetical protein
VSGVPLAVLLRANEALKGIKDCSPLDPLSSERWHAALIAHSSLDAHLDLILRGQSVPVDASTQPSHAN